MLWPNANRLVPTTKYTRISTKTKLGLGGIWSLIVGIKAINAKAKLATATILSDKAVPWKKIPKFSTANSHKGKNIVAKEVKGSL
jgi:hypothetical protein